MYLCYSFHSIYRQLIIFFFYVLSYTLCYYYLLLLLSYESRLPLLQSSELYALTQHCNISKVCWFDSTLQHIKGMLLWCCFNVVSMLIACLDVYFVLFAYVDTSAYFFFNEFPFSKLIRVLKPLFCFIFVFRKTFEKFTSSGVFVIPVLSCLDCHHNIFSVFQKSHTC